jgi:hypothetical protein
MASMEERTCGGSSTKRTKNIVVLRLVIFIFGQKMTEKAKYDLRKKRLKFENMTKILSLCRHLGSCFEIFLPF